MIDYSKYHYVTVEKKDKILTITLNRPDVLNAVNAAMHLELENIFSDVGKDEEVNAVILTGSGKAFCAGADVKAMDSGELRVSPAKVPKQGKKIIRDMLEIEQPVIAAVNGDAIGLGASLALFCDIVVVAENARIGDPHVKVGLVAGDGGTVLWPILVGLVKAKELLLTGNLITAHEAERIGLINKVVSKENLYSTVNELAQQIASNAPLAVRWTKMCINKSLINDVHWITDLSLATEAITMMSEDHQEATKAYIEKRKPQFRGL